MLDSTLILLLEESDREKTWGNMVVGCSVEDKRREQECANLEIQLSPCPGSNSRGINGTAEREERWIEMDEG